jgi:hypothetical protein
MSDRRFAVQIFIFCGLLAISSPGHAETFESAASACSTAATDMIAAMARGDANAATSRFDAPLRQALSGPTLSGAWDATVAQYGTYSGIGQPNAGAGTPQVPFVVTVPMHFASGAVDGVVACNAAGEVSGFHLVVPETKASESRSRSSKD